MSTFQTVHHNIQLPIHQQLLQLLGPDALRIESGERFDLVLICHRANDVGDIFRLRSHSFELFNDRFDLSDGEL